MGPTPSADLVGSILGVEDNDFKQQRTGLRKVSGRSTETRTSSHSKPQEDSASKEPPMQIVWRNVLIFIYLHAAALYGFYLCFTAAKASTLAWCKFSSHSLTSWQCKIPYWLFFLFLTYHCLISPVQHFSCFYSADLELRAEHIDYGLIGAIKRNGLFASLLLLLKLLLFRSEQTL